MALFQLFWATESTRRLPEGGDEPVIDFGFRYLDGVVTYGHESTAEATEHPIELQKDIADHVKPKLDVLTLDCMISDRPTNPLLLGDDNHPEAVLEELWSLKERRVPVDIDVPGRRLFENFLIIGINDQRDASTGAGARFTLTLREFRTATAQEVEAPSPTSERNRNRRDRGRQSAPEATENTTPSQEEVRRELRSFGFEILQAARRGR
jgi:hypothetical protein